MIRLICGQKSSGGVSERVIRIQVMNEGRWERVFGGGGKDRGRRIGGGEMLVVVEWGLIAVVVHDSGITFGGGGRVGWKERCRKGVVTGFGGASGGGHGFTGKKRKNRRMIRRILVMVQWRKRMILVKMEEDWGKWVWFGCRFNWMGVWGLVK